MNKPYGYVCSTVSDRRHTVYELLPEEYKSLSPSVNPVGRLDAETTGLLIFTNDGMFNHNMTIPENHISKKYKVTLEKEVDTRQQLEYTKRCRDGLTLPAEKKAPEYFAKNQTLEWINNRQCFLTISEGKFHQVRRTFLALNNKVTVLERVQIGRLNLQNLEPGQICIISPEDL